MGVGSKSHITDPYDNNEIARVVAGRLLVTTQAGGGGGISADVNIEAVGGVLIGTSVPINDGGGSLTIDGTVAVSSVAGTVTVAGTVSVTEPVSVDDNGGSLTVDGTVAVSSVAGTVTVAGTVAVSSVAGTVVVGDGGGSITVDGTIVTVGAFDFGSIHSATHASSPVASVRDDVLAVVPQDDGDYAPFRTTDRGALWVQHDGAVTIVDPVSVDDNGGSLTIDGTVAVSAVAGTVTVAGTVAVSSVAGTVTVAGTVAATQSGIWTVAATQSGAWTVAVTEPVSVDDNGGSLTIDGTVAVSAVAGTVTVAGTVAVSSVAGTVTVAGTVAVSSVAGTVTVTTAKLVDSVAGGTDAIFPVGVVRDDALATLAVADGDYTTLRVTQNGSLWVDAIVQPFTFPITIDQVLNTVTVGLAVDYYAKDGEAVIFADDRHVTVGVERDDAIDNMNAGVVDGDWTHLRVDSRGALWVRDRGDIVNVLVLSGSTDGAPIRITATTLGTAITLHTASATAGVRDRISLWASNIGGSGTVSLTVATVDGGANSETRFIVMGEQTVYLGIYTLEDSEVLVAYAGTANVIRVFGEALRHTA